MVPKGATETCRVTTLCWPKTVSGSVSGVALKMTAKQEKKEKEESPAKKAAEEKKAKKLHDKLEAQLAAAQKKEQTLFKAKEQKQAKIEEAAMKKQEAAKKKEAEAKDAAKPGKEGDTAAGKGGAGAKGKPVPVIPLGAYTEDHLNPLYSQTVELSQQEDGSYRLVAQWTGPQNGSCTYVFSLGDAPSGQFEWEWTGKPSYYQAKDGFTVTGSCDSDNYQVYMIRVGPAMVITNDDNCRVSLGGQCMVSGTKLAFIWIHWRKPNSGYPTYSQEEYNYRGTYFYLKQ